MLFFARGFGVCCGVASRGRVSPRRARYFSLLRQRKVPQRKATLLCVSLRCATGNLRCSVGGCCRRTHCALRAPFKHAAASQSTKCVCPAAHARTRRPALLGTHRRERGTSRAIAALGPVLGAHCALQAPQREARAMWAERSNGPCAGSHPCWLRLRRGVCGVRMRVEARMPRALTRRGCPNGARSAQ